MDAYNVLDLLNTVISAILCSPQFCTLYDSKASFNTVFMQQPSLQ